MISSYDVVKRLNSRAIKVSADKLKDTEKLLHGKNTSLKQTSANGWYHSWYVWQASTESVGGIIPLHESLHSEANQFLENSAHQNSRVILMSAYVAAMVTYTDSCRTMLHHYLPPFLHLTLKEMGIGMDTQTKPYPFPLNPQEQEGKEILYSYALLEMTGT